MSAVAELCLVIVCLTNKKKGAFFQGKLLKGIENKIVKTVTSVRRPKMKRDAGVKCCLFTIKRQHFTLGRRTDVMPLAETG